MIPTKTMVGVSRTGGTASMTVLSTAAMKPERSASPMPSMPTRTTPSGGKSTKLFTIVRSAQ